MAMHERLFGAALGITAPWSVCRVHFDAVRKARTVSIGYAAGSRFAPAFIKGGTKALPDARITNDQVPRHRTRQRRARQDATPRAAHRPHA
jgi:hypothetical protein